MNSRRCCIITPCRNEAAFARRTLDSVTRQSEPPALRVIVDNGFDYLCKPDLDLHLPPRYFSTLMDRVETEPRMGSCSEKPYFFAPGVPMEPVDFPLVASPGLISEKIWDENSVGASKFYRSACFRQIGGFVQELMWDCLLRGKARATSELEARQAGEWAPLRTPAGTNAPRPDLDAT